MSNESVPGPITRAGAAKTVGGLLATGALALGANALVNGADNSVERVTTSAESAAKAPADVLPALITEPAETVITLPAPESTTTEAQAPVVTEAPATTAVVEQPVVESSPQPEYPPPTIGGGVVVRDGDGNPVDTEFPITPPPAEEQPPVTEAPEQTTTTVG